MRLKTLLFLLPLFLSCFNGFAQTKKPSNTGKPQTQQTVSTTATREVGEDGYIWYKLKRGNLYGARDIEGKTIIPVKYKAVSYFCNDGFGTHCFFVTDGDFKGAYTRKGTMVVSPERHYVDLSIEGHGGKICWDARKNGSPERVVLDARGNELFSVLCESIYMTSVFRNGKYTDVCYLSVQGGGEKRGIYDLNGKEIVPLQKKNMYLQYVSDNKISLHKYEGVSGNYYNNTDEEIEYDGSTRYDYTPYEELYYEFKESRRSSSTSSTTSGTSTSSNTSSSSGSSSSSNSSNSTTTVGSSSDTYKNLTDISKQYETILKKKGVDVSRMSAENLGKKAEEIADRAKNKEDATVSIAYYFASAEKGYAPAQFFLSTSYLLGTNGKGYEEGMEWLGKAVAQGYKPAEEFFIQLMSTLAQ